MPAPGETTTKKKKAQGHFTERKQQKKDERSQKRQRDEAKAEHQRVQLEKRVKLEKEFEQRDTIEPSVAMGHPAKPAPQPATATSSAPSRLDKYRKKLDGAKFRMINESLYNGEALSSQDFSTYHTGFASQVEHWPTNPITVICSKLQRRKRCTIGDFGCGSAKLQQVLGNKHHVYSFDLVASTPQVIECDISKHVPLEDDTLDVAVFSLSLMGQDVTSFFVECNRVLKMNGEVIVAEVKSRFVEEDKETEETMGGKSLSGMKRGLKLFHRHLLQLGFTLLECDEKSNTMFVLMRFQKTANVDQASAKRIKMPLKNCPYKRR